MSMDIEFIKGKPEGYNAYAVNQFALQYLLYSISKLRNDGSQLEQSLQLQDQKAHNLDELLQAQVSEEFCYCF